MVVAQVTPLFLIAALFQWNRSGRHSKATVLFFRFVTGILSLVLFASAMVGINLGRSVTAPMSWLVVIELALLVIVFWASVLAIPAFEPERNDDDGEEPHLGE